MVGGPQSLLLGLFIQCASALVKPREMFNTQIEMKLASSPNSGLIVNCSCHYIVTCSTRTVVLCALFLHVFLLNKD